MCEVSLLNKWCVRGYSAKAWGPYCWATWPKQYIPICHQAEGMSSLFQLLPLSPLPFPLSFPLHLFLSLFLSFPLPLPLPLSMPSLPLSSLPSPHPCTKAFGTVVPWTFSCTMFPVVILFRSVWWELYAEVHISGSAFLFYTVYYHFLVREGALWETWLFFSTYINLTCCNDLAFYQVTPNLHQCVWDYN